MPDSVLLIHLVIVFISIIKRCYENNNNDFDKKYKL